MRAKTIQIKCKAADILPLDSIVEFQGGLKKRGKREIDLLIKSIEKYGFSFPFYVWQNGGQNHCLDGHGRIQALSEMRRAGYDLPLFPVVYIEADDEAEAKNKLLRLNSQYGQMTVDSVLEFTDGIEVQFDELMLHGDTLKVKAPQSETVGDDEAPGLEEEVHSKIGEIYELGPHRLMCGDSTDTDKVGMLMGGEKADLVFTDPPYGVAYTGGLQFKAGKVEKNNREMIKNDDVDIYAEVIQILKYWAKGPCYIWFAGTEAHTLYKEAKENGDIHALVIWVKNGGYGALNANYKQKHEPCLYWKPKGTTLDFVGMTTETTVWNIDKDGQNKLHPTQKPVALAEKACRNHGGKTVLDLFGGSGSTMIASAKTGRVARLMELDPKYCDVIRRRWTMWARENGHEVGSGGLEPVNQEVNKNG